MPSDATIYSMIRPPAAGPSPLEQYGALMNLRAMGDASALHALQRQKLQDDLQEEAAFKASIADWVKSGGQGDIPAAAMAASPSRYGALSKHRLDAQKTSAELITKDRENFIALLKESKDRMPAIKDQGGWATFRDEAIQRAGMFTTPQFRDAAMRAAQSMPAQFDPEYIRMNLVKADEFFAPKYETKNDGQQQVLWQVNPAAGKVGPVEGAPVITNKMTPEQQEANKRGWATIIETRRHNRETEQNTRRGQDLTESRERDVNLAANLESARVTARETAKNTVESQAQLPAVIAKGEEGLKVIDQMLGSKGLTLKSGEKLLAPHPGFQDYVGATWKPGFRFIDGTDAAGFDALYKQITGQAFLQAFESLKGGGQITQIEGEKATQAITRMNKAQSEEEFVKAAREFQGVIKAGIERAKAKAGPAQVPGQPRGASVMFQGQGGRGGGIRFLSFEGQ